MFYVPFIDTFLVRMRKWEIKKMFGDTAAYNQSFDGWWDFAPFTSIVATILLLLFYGVPFYFIVRGIWALPLSQGHKDAFVIIFFALLFLSCSVGSIVLSRKNRKNRQ